VNSLGTVSGALKSNRRTCVRHHGVAVWLDLNGRGLAFVDRLAAARENSGACVDDTG